MSDIFMETLNREIKEAESELTEREKDIESLKRFISRLKGFADMIIERRKEKENANKI